MLIPFDPNYRQPYILVLITDTGYVLTNYINRQDFFHQVTPLTQYEVGQELGGN